MSSPQRNWELTLYEQQRTPQEVITDPEVEIATSPSGMLSDFKCPVCLGLLKNTMTTECLHRFCQDCIVKALRTGNKECPTCRTKLKSKRSLRPDYTFDMLIAKLFPETLTQERPASPGASTSRDDRGGEASGSSSGASASSRRFTI
ncbi:hypothetical protein HPB48_002785 [Haemaphysalis longicornis]|uniref:RING-type E3 ubiquitin transferase n=1 Tax=Haemaphysalis longicornis TaxID=44386 RepID=A0A9J6GRG2_HAELO|nr:hypothetical protein HPB48_002785 [Haemaphysalis longicornis]